MTIFDIERCSYVDGPGIRTTVFVKGCNLDCAWCHNPESKSAKPQRLWYKNKCTGCAKCASVCKTGAVTVQDGELLYDAEKCTLCGDCAIFCPTDALAICGREADTDELLSTILRDKEFYKTTGGGVTVSGGECMLYPDFVAELFEKCRAAGIHTAADTAGCVPWEHFERVLPVTDLFLYDIKLFTPALHKKYTGRDNARILENYKKLLSHGAHVIVRVPMMAGVNDGEEFERILAFLRENPPDAVELLPYHAMGENKARAAGLDVQTFTAPEKAVMDAYKARIREIFQ